MKKLIVTTLIAGSALFGFGFGVSNQGNMGGRFSNVLNTYQKQSLSNEEKTALLHMREEEKLARDVYITLYNKWGIRIFSNISRAEQHHMDMVKMLLDRYNLPDNAANTESQIGVFNDKKVQNLYDNLVEQGSKSQIDALKVACTIEDLDIYDLEDYMAKMDNRDILFVFKNLTKGSRNHMRMFYRTLINYGGTYKPQYISQSQFNGIINSGMERGMIR